MTSAVRAGPWLVAAAALCAHAAGIPGGFLGWDDHAYVIANPFAREPSWEGLGRLFAEPYYGTYHPVHLASYALDRALFGDAAWGYHLLNVLGFAAASALLLAFLRRAFPEERWPLAAALLFAVHPVHVESVAWVTARKDVLALLFGMAYALAHLSSASAETARSRAAWYAAGLVAFALALLSKVVVASLPLALAAYDRIVARRRPLATALAALPHLALAALLGVIGWRAQADAGALREWGSAAEALLTPLSLIPRYLGLLVAPFDLSAIYEVQPVGSLADPRVLASLALCCGLAAGALLAARRGARVPLFALAWAALTWAPVSGIARLPQPMADRFLLFPSIAFAVFAGWGFVRLASHGAIVRKVAVGAGALVAAIWLAESASRSLDWRDDLALWSDAARKTPGSLTARINHASALEAAGLHREAAAELLAALRRHPRSPVLRDLLGIAARNLRRKGDMAGAERVRRALEP